MCSMNSQLLEIDSSNNGIGRTDLYKGDYETLVDSIQDKIFELEGDLPLFPGHGPYTTVDDEQLNPFLHG